jgi:phosphopantothenoylcysteine decarboxylase/phosphopantothenate--cysteine ligase
MTETLQEKRVWRVGLGVCGGIAAYKAIEVLRGLQKAGCLVKVAMTKHATEFIQPLTFRALTSEYVLVDDYEPDNPDPIAHINFSQNIDLLLIVPATANIIAKFANGIADDFLTSTYLASTAPVLIAPAMNTTMWFQPATQRNIETLRNDGVHFVQPVEGRLACETVGTGKLEDVEIIVKTALDLLKKTSNPQSAVRNPQLNERFLITSGGTREEIDPVRFISNYSSGKMGFALAEAARDRGSEVTLIVGAASVAPPENVKIIHAASAQAMNDAVLSELPNATVYVSAAAVADYRPKNRADNKIKKKDDALILELEKTPDILAEVSRQRHENLLVIGFAAETTNVLEHARQKLQKKNLDAIVANDVSRQDSGFGSDTNLITILTQNAEKPIEFPLMTKKEAAHKILDEVVKLRENNKLRVKP